MSKDVGALAAPFPYFGGKRKVAREVWRRFGDVTNYVECSGQEQSAGCLPTRLVGLLVDQRLVRRASTKAAVARSRYSGIWIAKCADLEVISRLDKSSLSLFSSLWWMPSPRGMDPLACSQTQRARSTHSLGSATLMKARCSLPRLYRVRIRTDPTGNLASCPYPRAFFIGVIIPCLLWRLHFRILVGRGKLQRRYGDVLVTLPTFVEPFFGSGAVLLNRPASHQGHIETVNDKDGYVANFWRAVAADPQTVAAHADWPVNENDLHARHAWLVGRRDALSAALEGDPEYYDAKIAGWWVWGMCAWIGGGFCSGTGPWRVVDGQLVHLGNGRGVNRQLVHLGDAGRGVNRKLVHLGDAGRGVNRQLVHLGNAGQGVNRKRVHLGNAGRGVNRKRVHLGKRVGVHKLSKQGGGIYEWFEALSARLRGVRVCSGDWTRVCGETPTINHGLTGVFLDPPYDQEIGRAKVYNHEDPISQAVREWAIEAGKSPLMRIALCGYEGEHEMPEGWTVYAWKAHGGYGSQGETTGRDNAHRERIWFSPYTLGGVTQGALL